MPNLENKPPFEGAIEIFCRYIKRKGKVIYPKNAKFFHFWVAQKSEKKVA